MNEYFKKIRRLVAEKAGLEIEDVEMDSYFEEDLNIGEMELIEILEETEEMFKVELMEYKDDIETVEDLVEHLAEQIE